MDYVIVLLLLAIVLLIILAMSLGRIPIVLQNMAVKSVDRNRMLAEKMENRRRNLELILGLFEKHSILTNAMIREGLGFDDRVIVNYMDELEKQGKVRQVGKTGMNAHYELIS